MTTGWSYSIHVTSLAVVTTACEFIGRWGRKYQPWLLLASFLFSQEEKKKDFGGPIVSRWQMYVQSVSLTELAVKLRYDWEEKFVRYPALGNSVSSYWSGSAWLEDSWSWMWKQQWLCGAISFFFFLFFFQHSSRGPEERTHAGLIMAMRSVAWPMTQNYPFKTTECLTIVILIASKQSQHLCMEALGPFSSAALFPHRRREERKKSKCSHLRWEGICRSG